MTANVLSQLANGWHVNTSDWNKLYPGGIDEYGISIAITKLHQWMDEEEKKKNQQQYNIAVNGIEG